MKRKFMGQDPRRLSLFPAKPLDTNMVICCTENLCGRTDTAPHNAHPLYRLSTASKRKIYYALLTVLKKWTFDLSMTKVALRRQIFEANVNWFTLILQVHG